MLQIYFKEFDCNTNTPHWDKHDVVLLTKWPFLRWALCEVIQNYSICQELVYFFKSVQPSKMSLVWSVYRGSMYKVGGVYIHVCPWAVWVNVLTFALLSAISISTYTEQILFS